MSIEKQRHIPEFDNAPQLSAATFDRIAGSLDRLTRSPLSLELLLEDKPASAYEALDDLPGAPNEVVGRVVYMSHNNSGTGIREHIEAAHYDPQHAAQVGYLLSVTHSHAKPLGQISYRKDDYANNSLNGRMMLYDDRSIDLIMDCVLFRNNHLFTADFQNFADKLGLGGIWHYYRKHYAGQHWAVESAVKEPTGKAIGWALEELVSANA